MSWCWLSAQPIGTWKLEDPVAAHSFARPKWKGDESLQELKEDRNKKYTSNDV